jgi:anti-sigma-K factor RskA
VTCDERRDSIFLLAAGQLEPSEAEELRRHIASGCPICAGALAEAETTLAQMSLVLDPIDPSLGAGAKLMSRIQSAVQPDGTFSHPATIAFYEKASGREIGAKSERPSERVGKHSSPWRIFTASLLSAAAAIAVTSTIFLYATRTSRQFFGSSDLQTVALTSDIQPQARGQVLWDRDHSQWRVSVFNLSPPAPGKEYELWFIPPGGKPMRSKTFNVDSSGSASLIVQVPTNIGPIALAAITDEPVGGVDAPTGKIQLAGKVPG